MKARSAAEDDAGVESDSEESDDEKGWMDGFKDAS